jgi:hypothetical protein
MSATDGSGLSAARSGPRHDIRVCPACGQMSFDVVGSSEGWVYCEFCGAEVAIAALLKTP